MGRREIQPNAKVAAAAGSSICLFMAPWVIPFIGAVFSLWTSAPLLAVYRLQGAAAGRLALMWAVAGSVLIALVVDSGMAALFFLFHAAAALALGEAHAMGVPEDRAIAWGAGASCAVLLLLALFSGALGGDWVDRILQTDWSRAVAHMVELNRQAGMAPESLASLENTLTLVGGVLVRLLPGMLAAGAVVVNWANLLLVRRITARGKVLEPLDMWKAPEWLVWVLIPAGISLALGEGFIYWLGANLLLILGAIYFFQGLAVIAYWLRVRKVPVMIKGVIYIMVALEIFLAVIVAAAGLFDMWFNFRRLGKQEPSD